MANHFLPRVSIAVVFSLLGTSKTTSQVGDVDIVLTGALLCAVLGELLESQR